MQKKTILTVICVFIIISSITAQAVDLPINIDAIGHQEGYGDAITTSFKIDLFSANAKKVSEAIAEYEQRKREQTSSELFESVYVVQELDVNEQIIGAVSEIALFAQPVNYGSGTKANENTSIPTWLIILLFVICAAGGFIWAFVSSGRKRRRESGVH